MKTLIIFFAFFSFSFLLSAAELRRGEVAYAKAPSNLAEVIQAHIAQMEFVESFDKISNDDFFHGHLIFRHQSTEPISSTNLLYAVSGILYHTAEYNNRWAREKEAGIPVNLRRPRSVFGSMDGRIAPASSMVNFELTKPHRQSSYSKSGTIYTEDLVLQHSELSELDHYFGRPSTPTALVWSFSQQSTKLIYVSSQFHIELAIDGDYSTPAGKSYNIYLKLRNTQKSYGYSNPPKNRIFLKPGLSEYPWL